jgi:hypothetical protein
MFVRTWSAFAVFFLLAFVYTMFTALLTGAITEGVACHRQQ